MLALVTLMDFILDKASLAHKKPCIDIDSTISLWKQDLLGAGKLPVTRDRNQGTRISR